VSAPIYWDSSAVVSYLFPDDHSEDAAARSRASGLHLLLSLGWAEVQAVLVRIERQRALTSALLDAAREVLTAGPWRQVTVSPEWKRTQMLAARWPLRGSDLWHLSAAMTLKDELPELRLLSYDPRLAAAAEGEGLAP
jgi:predicted nucleic acid-binding protein